MGNRILRIVATGLREYCGPTDYVARLGGDEFVMLVQSPNDADLQLSIERMRSVARKAGESTPEPSVLSISVGVATFPNDGTDAEQLLAEADRRMYKGKRQRKKDRASVVSMPPASDSFPADGSSPDFATSEISEITAAAS
jgi:diguanylate cyclase (GGDEF)-like protein